MPGYYSTVKDTIFTGRTGRELRHHPPEVRELQFWLTCGPDREPFGIFICEPAVIAPRIGRTLESLHASLEVLVRLEFCSWDPASQYVWVKEMAHHQFQTPLKAVDNRCALARKWYAACPRNPFLGPWFDRYVEDFHLGKDPHAVERRNGELVRRSPSPSPLGSPLGSPLEGADPAPCMNVLSEGEGVQGEGLPLKGAELEHAFGRLWANYPNAVEKKPALAAFRKAKPTLALVGTMLAAVEQQRQSKPWREGFIPKLANWIENERWFDRVDEQPVLTEKNSATLSAAQRFANRRGAHRES